MNSLQSRQELSFLTRVLASLSYAQVFGYPLSSQELWLRLWGTTTSPEAVTAALSRLQELGLVVTNGRWWALSSLPRSLNERPARRQESELKRRLATEQAAPLLRRIPWVRGVFVTGSVAAANALPQDDIDFMIVTAPRRLWLSRAALLLLTWGKGVRRPWQAAHSGSSVQNTWCFNLWLSTKSLSVEPSKRSYYTAYETLMAQHIWGDPNLPAAWLHANAWVRHYLPTWWQESCRQHQALIQEPQWSAWWWLIFPAAWLGDRVLDWLNLLAYWAQRCYMWPHQTHELVRPERAYFHPRHTGLQVIDWWYLRLRRLSGQPIRILVTGVFDVLHQEHQTFLQKARELGDELIVGLESDARVTRLKGPDRPIHSQTERRQAIRQLGVADVVVVLPQEFDTPEQHLAFLQLWQPAVLAVSSHTLHLETKQALMSQVGGRVIVVHQHNPEISSTKLIEQGVTTRA